MKEYQRYLAAVQRRLPLCLLGSLILAAGAYAFVARQGVTYKVHSSYIVSLAEREESPEYTFDGFYALQATELFTTTLAGWLQAPESIVAAYAEAGLPLPTDDVRRLVRHVTTHKTAPQLIGVVVVGSKRETVEKLAEALAAVTRRNVELYHDQGIPALHFRVVITEPWTSVSRPAVGIIVASVFIVTLLLLINVLLLWESLHHARSD